MSIIQPVQAIENVDFVQQNSEAAASEKYEVSQSGLKGKTYWYSFLWWSCLVRPTMNSTSNYSALLLFGGNYFSRKFVLISTRLIHGMHSSPCTPSPPLTHSLLTLICTLPSLTGRAGVPMEVMGLMLGEFVDDYTVRVIDVFAMPQSGTVSCILHLVYVFRMSVQKWPFQICAMSGWRVPEGYTVTFFEFLLSWTSEFLTMQLHRISVLLFL